MIFDFFMLNYMEIWLLIILINIKFNIIFSRWFYYFHFNSLLNSFIDLWIFSWNLLKWFYICIALGTECVIRWLYLFVLMFIIGLNNLNDNWLALYYVIFLILFYSILVLYFCIYLLKWCNFFWAYFLFVKISLLLFSRFFRFFRFFLLLHLLLLVNLSF